MKIGILTFHDGINHGAFMQAFSTYQYLLLQGFDVDIINYKNKNHYINEWKAFLISKRPLVIIQNIKKIICFRNDQKQMHLKPLVCKSNKLNNAYDVIVIGSDIVWNFENEFLGRDRIYFGKGLEPSKLVSYAPSFGSVSPQQVLPNDIVEGLKKFKNISVRDENSAHIVESAVGFRPQIVLDPTFLVDCGPFEAPIKIDQPYILVYAYFLRENEINSIIEYAREHNLKIISIGYLNKWADKNIVALGAFEWLSYFKHANCILTSTFHGTIFSIKYRKNFVTSINDNIKNKSQSILSELGLLDRVINNGSVVPVLERDIDYGTVYEKLTPLIESSRKYLDDALNL